jgi:hypothetical protein
MRFDRHLPIRMQRLSLGKNIEECGRAAQKMGARVESVQPRAGARS